MGIAITMSDKGRPAHRAPCHWKNRGLNMHHSSKLLYGGLKRGLFALRQAGILLVAALFLYWLSISISSSLAKNGIGFNLGFLGQAAGFDISEGYTLDWQSGLLPRFVDFVSSDTNAQALITGGLNTLKAAVIGIALATILGILVCIGSLSRNWLLRQICFLFIEFVRNTPPLIQLVFWYFAVILQLPALANSGQWLGALASRQGIYLPSITMHTDGMPSVQIGLAIAVLCLLCGMVKAFRPRRYLLLSAGVIAMAALQIYAQPFALSIPEAKRFSVSGGITISPELAAMLLGLIIYKSAFIAEITRGALQAIPKGQFEAAQSLRLSYSQSLRDVILPQVYRVVLPAFGNQYISLAKNTSLGIAIGFPDFFNVYGTVANQSGRSLEGMVVVVLAYLLLSLFISVLINMGNRRLLKTGARS